MSRSFGNRDIHNAICFIWSNVHIHQNSVATVPCTMQLGSVHSANGLCDTRSHETLRELRGVQHAVVHPDTTIRRSGHRQLPAPVLFNQIVELNESVAVADSVLRHAVIPRYHMGEDRIRLGPITPLSLMRVLAKGK